MIVCPIGVRDLSATKDIVGRYVGLVHASVAFRHKRTESQYLRTSHVTNCIDSDSNSNHNGTTGNVALTAKTKVQTNEV